MEKSSSISVILAAAGNSTRMGKNISASKQFCLLNNKPLLHYSLEKFLNIPNITEVIIVTNNVMMTKKILNESNINFNYKMEIVEGAELRQDSVYNGFCKINPNTDLVLIHDVARPLFEIEDVKQCIQMAIKHEAAILATPLVDTLKKAKLDNDGLIVETTTNRESLYLVQTPQVFSYKLLSKSYKIFNANPKKTIITDEAAMVELLGNIVSLVIGSRKNIKITYPEDLEVASSFVRYNNSTKKQKAITINN